MKGCEDLTVPEWKYPWWRVDQEMMGCEDLTVPEWNMIPIVASSHRHRGSSEVKDEYFMIPLHPSP